MGLNFAQSFLKAFHLEYSTSCCKTSIAARNERVYNVLTTMKSLKKLITGSLIIVLASLVGSFCMHPMVAQAAPGDMAMSVSPYGAVADTGGCLVPSGDAISHAINTCTSDCVTQVPQTINAKKVAVDNAQNFTVPVSGDQQEQFSELFSEAVSFSGTHPPSPDILFSVFKKE